MKTHRCRLPCWHHFGSLLVLFFNTFSVSNFACLFECLFQIFGRKWTANATQRCCPGPPFRAQKSPSKRSFDAAAGSSPWSTSSIAGCCVGDVCACRMGSHSHSTTDEMSIAGTRFKESTFKSTCARQACPQLATTRLTL